jgi:hypothetical protein
MNTQDEELNYDVWANQILQAESDESYGIPKVDGKNKGIWWNTMSRLAKTHNENMDLPLAKSQPAFKKNPELYNYVHRGPDSVKI